MCPGAWLICSHTPVLFPSSSQTPLQSYAADLEAVQRLYERHKEEPPRPRNAPPVAGRILWARDLLARIEAPMARFQKREAVLQAKDSKRVIRAYNRLAQVRGGVEVGAGWVQVGVSAAATAAAAAAGFLLPNNHTMPGDTRRCPPHPPAGAAGV